MTVSNDREANSTLGDDWRRDLNACLKSFRRCALSTKRSDKIRLWDEIALSSHRTSPEVAKQIPLAQDFRLPAHRVRSVNWSRLLHADIPSSDLISPVTTVRSGRWVANTK
jgi:hypothetical protein